MPLASNQLASRACLAVVLLALATLGAARSAAAQRSIDRFPRADAERPGALIGWHINAAGGALRRARAGQLNKLVLFIHREDVPDSVQMARDVLPCGIVNRLAGQAVFAVSSPGRDPALAELAPASERIPSIVVFRTMPDQGPERLGAQAGYVPADAMARFLAAALGVPVPAAPAPGDADLHTHRAYGAVNPKGCATGTP